MQIRRARGTENNKTRTKTSMVMPVLFIMAGTSLFKFKSVIYSAIDSIIKINNDFIIHNSQLKIMNYEL